MSLLIYPKFSAQDVSGVNLSGGLVYFYEVGTSTPKDTYTDNTLGTPNANPVTLDSRGEADIYLSGSYKILLHDESDVEIWSIADFNGTLLNTPGIQDNATAVQVVITDTEVSFAEDISVADDKTINAGDGDDIQMGYASGTSLGSLTVNQSAAGHFNFNQNVNTGEWRFFNDDSGGTSKQTLSLGGGVPKVGLFYDDTEQLSTASGGPTLNATPSPADNSLKIATTAYVDAALGLQNRAFIVNSAGTWSINNQTRASGKGFITGFTDTGVGQVTLDFTTATSVNNVYIQATPKAAAAAGAYLAIFSFAANAVSIYTFDDAGAPVDNASFLIDIFIDE